MEKEKWIKTSEQKPYPESNVETSEDGVTPGETMLYTSDRTCMLAGSSGGYGYFGLGFATDGSTGCETGVILDEPEYWRYI